MTDDLVKILVSGSVGALVNGWVLTMLYGARLTRLETLVKVIAGHLKIDS